MLSRPQMLTHLHIRSPHAHKRKYAISAQSNSRPATNAGTDKVAFADSVQQMTLGNGFQGSKEE